MNKMKISISLPESTIYFINAYLSEHREINRSQMIQQALELLREKELEMAYKEANQEIDHIFEQTLEDGLHEAW